MVAIAAAGITAAAAVGSAAMSGGKTGSTSQSSTSTPWGPQADQLNNLYGVATQTYQDRQNQGAYGGDYYSPINGIQAGTANAGANWAAGQGAALANGTAVTAGTLQGAAQPYVQNADQLAAGGMYGADPDMLARLQGYASGGVQIGKGIDPALSAGLTSGATTAANNIGSFSSGLQSTAAAASADPTAQIAANAQTYANSGFTDQARAAANADISQQFGEKGAGLDFAAAQGGALNSSRAGMANAMNNRSAAQAVAASDSSILNNAYNTGLSTAASQHTAGLNTAASANAAGLTASGTIAQNAASLQQQQSQFDTTSQLGAANSAISQGLAGQSLDAQTRLAANAQLGQAASTGVSAAGAANNAANSNFALGQSAGGIYQTDQNAILQNDLQKYQASNTYGQNILSPYAAILQQGYNGAASTTQTGSTSAPVNYIGSALGGAAAGYGLYTNSLTPGGSSGNAVTSGGGSTG